MRVVAMILPDLVLLLTMQITKRKCALSNEMEECILLYSVSPVIGLTSVSLSSVYIELTLLFFLYLLERLRGNHSSLQLLAFLCLCSLNPLFLSLFFFKYAHSLYWVLAPFLLLLPHPVCRTHNS